LHLSIEHRAAQGTDRLQLALRANPPKLALETVAEPVPAEQAAQSSCLQSIEQILTEAATPLSHKHVREAARMRTTHVSHALTTLLGNGRIVKSADGYRLNR
jgi:hypothetical protein